MEHRRIISYYLATLDNLATSSITCIKLTKKRTENQYQHCGKCAIMLSKLVMFAAARCGLDDAVAPRIKRDATSTLEYSD